MAKKIFTWLYYLLDLTLTKEKGDYSAKVKKVRPTRTLTDVAGQIVKEGSEYQLESIINILSRANRIKIDFLSMGDSVNDGMVIIEPAITGVFYDSAFNEKQHTCTLNMRSTNDVQTMLAQVKGEYSGLTVDNGGAVIEKITDSTTGSTTGEVTPGKVITLSGNKIRIVPEEGETVESCITYTNEDNETVTAQEDAPVINDPGRVVIQLPMLAAGSYTLTIKTLFSNTSTNLKAPRYITAKTKLTVL